MVNEEDVVVQLTENIQKWITERLSKRDATLETYKSIKEDMRYTSLEEPQRLRAAEIIMWSAIFSGNVEFAQYALDHFQPIKNNRCANALFYRHTKEDKAMESWVFSHGFPCNKYVELNASFEVVKHQIEKYNIQFCSADLYRAMRKSIKCAAQVEYVLNWFFHEKQESIMLSSFKYFLHYHIPKNKDKFLLYDLSFYIEKWILKFKTSQYQMDACNFFIIHSSQDWENGGYRDVMFRLALLACFPTEILAIVEEQKTKLFIRKEEVKKCMQGISRDVCEHVLWKYM